MRFAPTTLINAAAASGNTTSDPVDVNQIIKFSAQVVTGTGTATGSMQLQVTNDKATQPFPDSTFTNWSNLGSPVSVTTAGVQLIASQEICHQALRAVYTDSFANVSTITAVADSSNSLNSTYFLASSITADYYFWFSSGTGVDPAIAGRTGVAVTFTTNDTAVTIGGLIRTAAATKGWTVTGSNAVAILTNSVGGPTTIASDGAGILATRFTIANTQPTAAISVNLAMCGV